MNHSGNRFDDSVEIAAAALRETAIPAGPSEALIQQTLARAGVGKISGTQKRGWWSMKMVRRTAVAAGLAIVVGATALLSPWGVGARVAFADVVQQVRAAQALRCTISVAVKGDASFMPQTSEVLIVEPGWTITKSSNVKMIMSLEKGKLVMLMDSQKQAVVMELNNLPANAPQRMNLLNEFKKVDGKDAKPLGEKEIEGHQTRGFEVIKNDMDMKIWADVKTDLPVYVEMSGENPMLNNGTFILTGMNWSPKYDASELSVEVPTGYTVTTSQVDASLPKEADVVAMLSKLAEINDGIFPDSVGVEAFSKTWSGNMAKREAVETAGMSQEGKTKWERDRQDEIMKIAAPIGRGWAFIQMAKAGTDWHYAKGAKLGDKSRAVLWYKPAGKELYRVICADLTVVEEKESNLPAGNPVNLGLFVPVGTTPPVVVHETAVQATTIP